MSEANALRFWMTRPEGTGDELTHACQAANIDVIQLPLMDIVPYEDSGVAARLVMDLDHYSHVIFISGNAVRYGMGLIEQYWPQLPIGIQWLAIGEATAKALSEYDVDVVSAGGVMNSEALLALPELQAGEQLQRVLIMRGVGGREHLADSLSERGAKVDYCELYQRVVPDYPQGTLTHLLDNLGVNCWLASSLETLNNGLALSRTDKREDVLQMPVIVPSQRVASAAREAGCQCIVMADNAGCEAVMAALLTIKG